MFISGPFMDLIIVAIPSYLIFGRQRDNKWKAWKTSGEGGHSNKWQISVTIRIQNIPIVGPILDIVIREAGSRIGQQRLYEIVASLDEAIRLIDQYKVDKPYLDSDEFYSLLYRYFEKSLCDRYNEKRILYAKILANSMLIENSALQDNSEDFLSVLDDITPKDLIVLKNIYEQQKHMQPYYQPDDN
jgi:hypothetical protein